MATYINNTLADIRIQGEIVSPGAEYTPVPDIYLPDENGLTLVRESPPQGKVIAIAFGDLPATVTGLKGYNKIAVKNLTNVTVHMTQILWDQEVPWPLIANEVFTLKHLKYEIDKLTFVGTATSGSIYLYCQYAR